MKYKLGGQQRITLILVVSLILQLFTGMNVYAEESSILTKNFGGMTATVNKIILKDNQTNEEETQGDIGSNKESAITNDEVVNIYYKIQLDSPMDYTTGEAISIELPEVLKVNTNEEKYIARITAEDEVSRKNIEIGICEIDKITGKGIINFYDKLKEIDADTMDITVGIQAKALIDAGSNENEPIKLPFKMESVKAEVPVYVKHTTDKTDPNPEALTIEKSCAGFDTSTGEMIWEINIQGGTKVATNVALMDYFDEDQMEFKEVYWKKDNTKLSVQRNYVKDNIRILEMNIGNVLPKEKKSVVIRTVVKNSALMRDQAGQSHIFTNKAKLMDQEENELAPETKATQEVKVEWISKGGKSEAAGVRTISWEVKINEIHSNLNGYVLMDKIPKGLELMKESVKLTRADKKVIDFGEIQEGSSVSPGECVYKPYGQEKTEHVIYSKEGLKIDEDIIYIGELQYQFPKEDNYASYTLTYETKVIENDITNVNKKGMFYNYAALGDGKNILQYDYAGVGYEANLIEKTGEYSRSNHTATWTITVNKSCFSIKNSQVIDELPKEFELRQDSIRIKQDKDGNGIRIGKSASEVDENIDAYYKLEGQKLTIYFIGEMKKSYDIVFETPIKETYKKLYTTNLGKTTRINEAVLCDSSSKALTEEPAKHELEIQSTMIDKAGATYDYATREITWLIHVNYNLMPITNAKVKDIIPTGQSYVENSMRIKRNFKKYEEMKAVETNDITPTINLEDAEEGTQLNIGLGDIDKIYTIMYKTKLTEEYAKQLFATTGKREVENTAILYGDEIVEEGVKAKGTQKIDSELLSKTGIQDGTNEPIKWTITINKNQKLLDKVTLTDALENGLKLETSSMHLYAMTVSEQGTLTVKEEMVLKDNEDYSIVYDDKLNKLEFTFLKPIKQCYQLIFETEVIDENPASSYSNTAYISGDGMEGKQEASSNQVDTLFITSGGTMKKMRGSVEITKVDKDNEAQVLSGAVFKLIDYNGYTQGEKVTDENGKIIFDNLRLNKTYTVEEVSPPKGYELDQKPIVFKLSKKGEVQHYSVENSKKVYNIQFKKINEEGEGLQGAKFELYSTHNLSEVLSIGMSDAKGNVNIAGISFGEYILKEAVAPSNYIKDEKDYSVVVDKEGNYVIKKVSGESVTEIINQKQESSPGQEGDETPSSSPEPSPKPSPEPRPESSPEPRPESSPSPSRTVEVISKPSKSLDDTEETVEPPLTEDVMKHNEGHRNSDENKGDILEGTNHGIENEMSAEETDNGDLANNHIGDVNEETLPKLGDNLMLKFIILLGGVMILTGSGLLGYRRRYFK